MADTEHEYIVQRYREIHDLLHVLHGIPINLYGELALKAREFFLTKMMLSGLSCAFAPIGLSKVQMKYFFKVAVPWAIYSACESVDLMNIFYEKHFEEDIDELRRQWGIVTLPGIKGLR